MDQTVGSLLACTSPVYNILAGTLPPDESPTYVETWQEMEKLLAKHPGKGGCQSSSLLCRQPL